jgi:hypothetical protein
VRSGGAMSNEVGRMGGWEAETYLSNQNFIDLIKRKSKRKKLFGLFDSLEGEKVSAFVLHRFYSLK